MIRSDEQNIFDTFVDLMNNFMLVLMIFEIVSHYVSAKLLKLLYQYCCCFLFCFSCLFFVFFSVVTKTDYLKTSLI